MRPDRFGQSKGGEFIESRGRDRDNAFRDVAVLSKIQAVATIFGFVPYSTTLERITEDAVMYPSLRVHEEYADGGTHDVLLETTGDVVPDDSDASHNITWTELGGAFQPAATAYPISVVSQTETVQTLQAANPGFAVQCTSTNTLEGDAIPIQDYLHELYRLHKPLSDFDEGAWRMVRNAVTHGLALRQITSAGGYPHFAGSITVERGSEYVYGRIPAARVLVCGAIASTFFMLVNKTLMEITSTGFSDWINERTIREGIGQAYTTKRCLHATGVEVLQPPPIDMTDPWFDNPSLGHFIGTDFLDLFRWARPAITPPAPTNQWIGTLPQCNA